MTEPDSLFFYFLRKGLFHDHKENIERNPTPKEWKQIFDQANSQAVSGLIIDGIANSDVRPEHSFWEQKIIDLIRLEEINKTVIECGEKWLKRLENSKINSFIFKGSSVAKWYNEPLHRETGDVDIVIQDKWERVKPLLEMNKMDFRNEHGDLILKDGPVTVEFHEKWEYAYNPSTNERLQSMCNQADKNNHELYLACLILHLRRHFLTYGIGLKQVCDIAMMLHSRKINHKILASILKDLNTDRFSRVLFGFIDCYLHGNLKYPLLPIKKGYDFNTFCKVILEEGYMLKTAQEKKAQNSNKPWKRILRNTGFWIKRSIKLYHLMPDESIWFLIYMLHRRILILCTFNHNK